MTEENLKDEGAKDNIVKPLVSGCIASAHAVERAKERLGWNEKVLYKMMQKAFNEGIQHKDTKGTLHRYITKLWFNYKHCNNMRIYGEVIFFFCDKKLITIYQLETKLRKHLQYCR